MKLIWANILISFFFIVVFFMLFGFVFPILRIEHCNAGCVAENISICECSVVDYQEPFDYYSLLRFAFSLIGITYLLKEKTDARKFLVSSLAAIVLFGLFYLVIYLIEPTYLGLY